MKKKLLKLENITFIAIILGLFFGYFFKDLALNLKVIGDIYISLLKMLIIPLVFASIFIAIVGLKNKNELKSIGIKAFLYYISTTALAVILGLLVVNIINPGSNYELTKDLTHTITPKEVSISDFLLSFIPTNIFNSLSNGKILPIIFFAIIFAISAMFIEKNKKEFLYNFFDSINDSFMILAKWIINLTPIGVFFLIAFTVAKNGIEPIMELYSYFLTVILALFTHAFFTLGIILYFFGKINPFTYFSQVKEALMVAFSTASSSATLPVSIEIAELKAKIDKKVAGFVLPLGATINMDGTALYESIAVMFIANISGVELSLTQQITIFIMATFASIGAAGIPGAGLIMMTMILDSVGLSAEYIALIITVDRFLDMFRTSINVWGDLIGAKIINQLINKT
ncbi:dicarboxylate/amino acid:cation symporter [Nitrosophilus kaiyonis]|uniref:dicarboxylate/amino acid:cation symporter n=1 Tax=Nitrosophilus kaiyonis TaxID=2930200 RepID=UPI0024915861|nr:dicarboxylate/amino acid:cation symporter [Nitrosophilus kaiyonis]